MSLNDSLDQVERAKLAVWDYPVSDKFTNMWVSMEQSKFPETFEEAIYRVKNEDFAFIGTCCQSCIYTYMFMFCNTAVTRAYIIYHNPFFNINFSWNLDRIGFKAPETCFKLQSITHIKYNLLSHLI